MEIIAMASNMASPDAVFERHVQDVGRLSLQPLNVPKDIPQLHDWMTRDYARFWNMQNYSLKELEDFYRTLMESGHACAFMGQLDGKASFLVECYDPRHDQIGKHYAPPPGDYGMHFLLAPAETPVSGFSYAVICTILEFMFSDKAVSRIVVEPDIQNDKIHVLNTRAGFEYDRQLELPEKTAHLAFCTREQFAAALSKETQS